jgi:hypothetical protein
MPTKPTRKGMSTAAIARAQAAEVTLPSAEQTCRAAIEAFRAEHEAWSNSRFRFKIDREFSDAFEALIDAFSSGRTGQPRGWEGVFKAVAALRDTWQKYCAAAMAGRTPSVEMLWRPVEEIYHALKAIEPREKPPLEPVKVLFEQGVSLDQIGRMHRIVDANGNSLVHIVRRLIDEPDTDPATIEMTAAMTEVDYWREGLSEDQARRVLPHVAPDEITRLWAEFEGLYGPQKYMAPEERANYENEKSYHAHQQKVIRSQYADRYAK